MFNKLKTFLKIIFSVIVIIVLFSLMLILFKGVIYIEILIIFILFLLYIGLKLYFKITKKKLLENYLPENDKARKHETKEFIRESSGVVRESPESGNATSSGIRPEQSEGRKLLPSTEVDDDGENSSSPRKTSKGLRGFFANRGRGRRRRRNH